MPIPSYPSLRTSGHREVGSIFDGEVVIQEKVDGSQFSCGVFVDETGAGVFQARSKGATLHIDAPDKMFAKGIEAMKALSDKMKPGYIYRGEYLQKPKHNTLAYDRAPNNYVILFDIEDTTRGEQYFLSPEEVRAEAERLGLEVVPEIFRGKVSEIGFLRGLLERVSILGGAKIEGVVIKNYNKFTADGKVMMAKFVSEAFKEVHGGEWRKNNPTRGDIVNDLVLAHRTPARFAKAVQHLREAGRILGTPQDIGPLIKEVGIDVHKECAEDIKEALFKHFWPEIQRKIIAGVPQWYKDQLMEDALRADSDPPST